MDKITGQGCPSIQLQGVVGQFYENTDNGDIYECQSIMRDCDNMLSYMWVLRASGEHVDRHAQIFGGGSGGSSGGGGRFIVHLDFTDDGTNSIDKTHAEILAAHNAGADVQVIDINDSIYRLQYNPSEECAHEFIHVSAAEHGQIDYILLRVDTDDTLTYKQFYTVTKEG